MDDIVILSGARTAIGTFGGSLAGTTPIDTGTVVAKAALERAGVEGERAVRRRVVLRHVACGCAVLLHAVHGRAVQCVDTFWCVGMQCVCVHAWTCAAQACSA